MSRGTTAAPPLALLLALATAPRAALAGVVGTCGSASPSKVQDCQNVDWGSCGNACCKLAFIVEEDTATVVQMLNSSLSGGGPDGLFTLQPTAEGSLGFADLRPFKKPVDFIGQVHHTTSGSARYNDTIDFTIAPKQCAAGADCGASGSVIHAFSLSLIGGAYGDNGQNYKNIAMAIKSVTWRAPPVFGADAHQDSSCPAAQGQADSRAGKPSDSASFLAPASNFHGSWLF